MARATVQKQIGRATAPTAVALSLERGLLDARGTFYCAGCCRRKRATVRHGSGFCHGCIRTGRAFWRERLSRTEILELALMIWPEDRGRLAA